MTMNEMVNTYNALSAADGYIFGFVQNHLLYYAHFNGHLPQEILKADRASSKRGGMAKIRVRAAAAIRKAYIASGLATLIGAESLLETEDRYNKGERFERIITEMLTNEKWSKDSVRFDKAGDIRLNGKEIQIKLDNAELTNEKVLEKILAEK